MDTPIGPIAHHLLRAYLAWFVEHDISPIHIRVMVGDNPSQALRDRMREDGTIILNVSPRAVQELTIDDKGVGFKAFFDSIEHYVFLPLETVYAIDIPLGNKGIATISLPNYNALYYSINGVPATPPTPEKPKVSLSIVT